VIRTNLRYHAPSSVEEACRILAASDSGAVIGGGTMIVPRMTRGEDSVLDAVHVRNLGLSEIHRSDEHVSIGAGVTYTQVLEAPEGSVPSLLTTVARGITGGAQIRNQGTLVGSASYANPSSDVPAALVALDATVHVQGTARTREVAASEFFRGPFSVDLGPDELVTTLTIPHAGGHSGYAKLKLSESSWPIVTAAAVAIEDAEGSWRYRLAIGGASAVPVSIDLAFLGPEQLHLDAQVAGRVRQTVQDAIVEPWSDELAPGSYRHQVAGPVALKALTQLQKEMLS
jgi:CO/xanthine dehydrogenase FAD-binding subunit